MKNKIYIGLAILVLLIIGYRIFSGLKTKSEEEIAAELSTTEASIPIEEAAAVVDSAVVSISPQEEALNELNDAISEYNDLAVNGSIYRGNRFDTFEIAKEDEGIIFINSTGNDGNNSKITFNIKDVLVEYGVSGEGTDDEQGEINQSKHKVIIICRLEKKFENLSKKKQNEEEIDEVEYEMLYNDETTRSCIIENGGNRFSTSLYVYNKNHANKVMKAFTNLRKLF